MGFFDAIKEKAKSLTDRVTGGYGNIQFNIDRDQIAAGEAINVQLNIQATGELKAKQVLIRLKGTENCRAREIVREPDGSTHEDTVSRTNITLEQTFPVCGQLEMNSGETKAFNTQITIPRDCQPTYQGVDAYHQWELEADVDVPWGKDLKQSVTIFVR